MSNLAFEDFFGNLRHLFPDMIPTHPSHHTRLLLQRDVSGQFNRRPPSGVCRDIECCHVCTKVGFFGRVIVSKLLHTRC